MVGEIDMKTIEERARLAAWQIYEEIGLSKHSVDRVSEIIADKIIEQKAIDEAELLKLKSSWEKEAQINHDDEANYKQGYHNAAERACKLIDNYIADLAYPVGWADAKLLISIPERLRKAMEK